MANIIVCSKYPNKLQLEATKDGKVTKFIIDGANVEQNASGLANENGPNKLHGACGFTTVDEDLFKVWAEQNKESKLLKNSIIFTAKKNQDAKAQKKEKAAVKTGIEGIDPNNPVDQKRTGVKAGDVTKGV